MPVDVKRMSQAHRTEAANRGGSAFYKFPVGKTVFAVCPPTEEMGGLPYVKVLLHFNVGGKCHVCLSRDNEEFFALPSVQAYLEKKEIEIDLDAGCPTCAIDPSDLPPGIDDDKLDRMRQTASYYFPIVPMFEINDAAERIPLPDAERSPRLITPGPGKIYDGICDVIEAEGDITNPEAAILVRCTKKITRGPKGEKTSYSVDADGETLRKPIVLPRAVRAAIAQDVRAGGDCDPIRLACINLRTFKDVEALIRGDRVETRSAPVDPGKPRCFGVAPDPSDAECKGCTHLEACAAKKGIVIKEKAPDPTPARTAARTSPTPAARTTMASPTPAARTSSPAAKSSPATPVRSRVADPDPEPEAVDEAADPDPDQEVQDVAIDQPADQSQPADEEDDLAKFEAEIRGRRVKK